MTKSERSKPGSIPSPRIFSFEFGKKLGKPECPYIQRWMFGIAGLFSIRLHRWIASDDLRHPHDHPWWYLTFVLRGGYTDVSPEGDTVLKAGSIRFFPSSHKHSVKVNKGGCWTLLITGPESREWGFWVNQKFRRRNKYFFEFGHHPCDQGES